MSIRRSSLICVAYLQVYERVADNRWWPNIGGLLYARTLYSNGSRASKSRRSSDALSNYYVFSSHVCTVLSIFTPLNACYVLFRN